MPEAPLACGASEERDGDIINPGFLSSIHSTGVSIVRKLEFLQYNPESHFSEVKVTVSNL